MKILAFRVHQAGTLSLPDLAARILGEPLSERSYLGRNDLRLENSLDGANFLALVFGKPRLGHGPGQMGRDVPLGDITLGQGRNFGEDTAMVVDKASGYAAMQYNHFGPRARSIEQYLSTASFSLTDDFENGFRIGAVLRRDVVERIRAMDVIKEVDYTVSIPGLVAADRAAGRSLGAAVGNPHPEGTETLRISYRANRARDASLRPDDVRSLLEDLLPFVGSGALRNAKVVGRMDEGAERETIDLIEEQIAHTVPILPGSGQRLDLNERWTALRDTLRQWLMNDALQG